MWESSSTKADCLISIIHKTGQEEQCIQSPRPFSMKKIEPLINVTCEILILPNWPMMSDSLAFKSDFSLYTVSLSLSNDLSWPITRYSLVRSILSNPESETTIAASDWPCYRHMDCKTVRSHGISWVTTIPHALDSCPLHTLCSTCERSRASHQPRDPANGHCSPFHPR